MKTLNHQQIISCPNCGGKAKRLFFVSHSRLQSSDSKYDRIVQTECPICDYLMVMSSVSGRVIEIQI